MIRCDVREHRGLDEEALLAPWRALPARQQRGPLLHRLCDVRVDLLKLRRIHHGTQAALPDERVADREQLAVVLEDGEEAAGEGVLDLRRRTPASGDS